MIANRFAHVFSHSPEISQRIMTHTFLQRDVCLPFASLTHVQTDVQHVNHSMTHSPNAVQADRVTDALFIAAMGGSELLQRAQDELMKRQPRPYMQVIRAVMKSDVLGKRSP